MVKQKRNHTAERLSMIKLARAMRAACTNETDRRVFIGLMSDGIFQREQILTGLISEEAAENLATNGTKPTKEHFHPRKKSAIQIFDLLEHPSNVTDEWLHDFIVERSHVHCVTKTQNKKLVELYKEHPDLTPDEAYSKLNIALIPRVRKKRSASRIPRVNARAVEIDRIVYDSCAHAAAAIPGMYYAKVYQRCNSNGKKWQTWKFV